MAQLFTLFNFSRDGGGEYQRLDNSEAAEVFGLSRYEPQVKEVRATYRAPVLPRAVLLDVMPFVDCSEVKHDELCIMALKIVENDTRLRQIGTGQEFSFDYRSNYSGIDNLLGRMRSNQAETPSFYGLVRRLRGQELWRNTLMAIDIEQLPDTKSIEIEDYGSGVECHFEYSRSDLVAIQSNEGIGIDIFPVSSQGFSVSQADEWSYDLGA